MPELPEVETVRRGLAPVLVGQKFHKVVTRRADLRFPFPDNFSIRLEGQAIEALNRRAKYLLAHLSGGEILVMHLGMSGRFVIAPPANDKGGRRSRPGQFVRDTGYKPQHDHVIFEMADGGSVTYNDARRFGFMLLVAADSLDEHRLFCRLGPEPLGNTFNAEMLASAARGRKCDLKAFLMDQRVVAGLGNIYVCEALYRAGLKPGRCAATLSGKAGKPLARCEHLVGAIRSVLRDAIAVGGSSLRDYRQTDGSLGYFQHRFAVYGREGQPCSSPLCDGIIRRKVDAGRSTFYCPRCQK
ncbi:MAG TPA: bifunctional DNA-formamidopyrimidine glycosylase/DNA-(apurinic or apyrimidinic site) lyase [Rhizobiales bacterium]|nr:bifunctional DNA-formamidopyrimidine glycosylase/DNA-(apurinic or apyrimidinic site) lyase [Hyphomicrobiales bacterium]